MNSSIFSLYPLSDAQTKSVQLKIRELETKKTTFQSALPTFFASGCEFYTEVIVMMPFQAARKRRGCSTLLFSLVFNTL